MSSNTITIEGLVFELISFVNDNLLLGKLKANTNLDLVCFDCNLWNSGYVFNNKDVNDPYEVIIPPIRSSVLIIFDKIIAILNSQLADFNNKNFTYKSQVDRFLHIIIELKNKVLAVNCIDNCYDVNSLLLSTLIETLLQLSYILELINTLMTYINNCDCLGRKVFEMFMGKFVNSITSLSAIIPDWNSIIIIYLQINSSVTQSYIASYVPKPPINMPPRPTPISHACVPYPSKIDCPPQNNNY